MLVPRLDQTERHLQTCRLAKLCQVPGMFCGPTSKRNGIDSWAAKSVEAMATEKGTLAFRVPQQLRAGQVKSSTCMTQTLSTVNHEDAGWQWK